MGVYMGLSHLDINFYIPFNISSSLLRMFMAMKMPVKLFVVIQKMTTTAAFNSGQVLSRNTGSLTTKRVQCPCNDTKGDKRPLHNDDPTEP